MKLSELPLSSALASQPLILTVVVDLVSNGDAAAIVGRHIEPDVPSADS